MLSGNHRLYAKTNPSTIQLFNPLHPSRVTLLEPDLQITHTRISKFAALIKKFFPLPSREREIILRKELFNHSPLQLPSHFTLHSSLINPSPLPSAAHSSPVRTSIPQGERENILLNKPFNLSPVPLFNSPHPSPFTLHFATALSPSSILFKPYSSGSFATSTQSKLFE